MAHACHHPAPPGPRSPVLGISPRAAMTAPLAPGCLRAGSATRIVSPSAPKDRIAGPPHSASCRYKDQPPASKATIGGHPPGDTARRDRRSCWHKFIHANLEPQRRVVRIGAYQRPTAKQRTMDDPSLKDDHGLPKVCTGQSVFQLPGFAVFQQQLDRDLQRLVARGKRRTAPQPDKADGPCRGSASRVKKTPK